MRWQNGRLQIWNWSRQRWWDFMFFKYAWRFECEGKSQIVALECDRPRLTEAEDAVRTLPDHPPGWFAYQALLKIGFELVKSETLEVEVLEDAA